ncbi:peptide chain release factor N(5)-glutamine methyltransferase [Orenia marismortui]|uniref:Release factor glutamine methyltransferase n=1 Tax=Orenia marismortui TaxID=46469 RepID=A0A4R8HG30_9FIRM|nr:peptide chain release factor N(5)-glutamine methyltransferase [Orenia marismortui]TDX59155.1 release factor glutamine methyltransferase [Orenia marismortui]
MDFLTVKEILDRTVKHFEKYNINSPRLDAEVLLSQILEMERIDLYVNFDRPLTKKEIDLYRDFVVSRSKGIPVAYILAKQEFMSLDFKVDKSTLIPRPETEHLVEALLDKIEDFTSDIVNIADIGTGTGAIIISIAKYAKKHINGIAIDISSGALKVAKENAMSHQVEGKIEFRLGNLLEPIDEELDIIVSNPPYIPTEEIEGLQDEVKNEPLNALDGGEDGLAYYRQIIDQANNKLKAEGILAFEIGINQGDDVIEILNRFDFYQIERIKDYAGIERVILAKKK